MVPCSLRGASAYGCSYVSRVVRVEGQLEVVQGCGKVVDIESEGDKGDQTIQGHPSPHATTR